MVTARPSLALPSVLFNSLTFALFFVVVWLLHARKASWRTKKVQLLVASYLFYAAWNPPFVALLWLSTVVDFKVAQALHRSSSSGRRKLLLALSLAVNLGVLAFFKYGNFALDNTVALLDAAGVAYQPPEMDIVLPMGISFYTFQTLAYSLDVYLKRAKPTDDFLDFALFVTFFPQLVAGPIVRPRDLLPQFTEAQKIGARRLAWGAFLMTLGLFEKTVLADGGLAPAVEAVYDAKEFVAPQDAWVGTMAFSAQIFCDFAGYSTTAIGAALCLGFSLPDNFRFPYASIGFSDFWRRWHISLSTWLRDYLYIPLGGNRRGAARTQINLWITMLLGGLWHGASWTFVAWGAVHGSYLVIERRLRAWFGDAAWVSTLPAKVALGVLTYLAVCLAWVFFRAPDFGTAWRLLQAMLGLELGGEPVLHTHVWVPALGIVLLVLATHVVMRNRVLEEVVAKRPAPLVALVWALMAFGILLTQGSADAFIYFQF